MNVVRLAILTMSSLSPLAYPAPLQQSATGEPPCWPITPAEGWGIRDLGRGGTLVFRDGEQLAMLDIRSGQLAQVHTTQHHFGFSTPTWSQDGKLLFDFEQQVIAIAAEDGQITTLSSYPVERGWTVAYPEQDVPRYVHDAKNHRLLYVELSLQSVAPPRLVAIDMETHTKTTLIDSLGEKTRGVAISLQHEKVFAAAGDKLVTWSLNGKKLANTTLPGVCANPTLSSDNSLLAVAKYVNYRETDTIDRDKGCWIVDSATMNVIDQLDFGQEFVWSFGSNRLAFLRWSEELWIYTAATRTRSMIASLTLLEGTSNNRRNRYYAAPAWSHDDGLLACTLARPSGERSDEFLTLLVDLEARLLDVRGRIFQYLTRHSRNQTGPEDRGLRELRAFSGSPEHKGLQASDRCGFPLLDSGGIPWPRFSNGTRATSRV